MRKYSAYLAAVSFLLSLCFFSFTVYLWRMTGDFFRTQERYYSAPREAENSALILRSDSFGKGHFGARRSGGRTHKGIDILARLGQPILAAKSGRISYAGFDKGYGLYIEIYHPDGLKTRYAHLNHLYVRRGEWVRRGEPIGVCGKTGNAFDPRIKPHLHFEILCASGSLNPTSGLLDPKTPIRRA